MKTGVQLAMKHRKRKLEKIGCAMIVTWFLMIFGIELIGRNW